MPNPDEVIRSAATITVPTTEVSWPLPTGKGNRTSVCSAQDWDLLLCKAVHVMLYTFTHQTPRALNGKAWLLEEQGCRLVCRPSLQGDARGCHEQHTSNGSSSRLTLRSRCWLRYRVTPTIYCRTSDNALAVCLTPNTQV